MILDDPTPPTTTLEISASRIVPRIVGTLFAVEAVLVVLDLTFAFRKVVDVRLIQRLFNLAREDGLGTWFGTSQALVVALLLLLVAIVRQAKGWALIGMLFAWVSADDALAIHERAGPFIRDLAFGEGSQWFPSYSWQLVFGPPLAIAGLAMAWFLWHNLARALWPWFVASLALFAVAIGLDFVEGVDGAFETIAETLSVRTYTVSHLSKITEETLELAATTSLLGVFLGQLLRDLRGVQISISPN